MGNKQKNNIQKMKYFVLVIVLLALTARSQQGAKAVITALADKCMNGNNVPAAAQGVVHTAINTAFAAIGRRRLRHGHHHGKNKDRRLGTMQVACNAVYNAAIGAAGIPTAAANCFRSDFNNKCVSEVSA